jgi:tRNA dimethylallyltransferase
VALAQRFGGEIINADAIQMYKGLPIATNKITEDEKQGVTHHLLGCIELEEEPWIVGKFVSEASRIIREIRARGNLPILVGGTHYYTQALLFYKSVFLEEKDTLSVEDQERRWPILAEDSKKILEELWKVDPIMAAKWHPNDKRKIRRSLEIWLETGKPASEIYLEHGNGKIGLTQPRSAKETPGGLDSLVEHSSCPMRYDTVVFWLHAASEVLKDRLNTRVEIMTQNGLLDEVQYMDSFYLSQTQAGMHIDRGKGIGVAIGFKEFEEYNKGLRDGVPENLLAKMKSKGIERTQAATRQYAKRQVRWIRLKLLPAFRQTRAAERIFLLDSTYTSEWNINVQQKAAQVLDLFLEGSPLPDPVAMSKAAAEFLSENVSSSEDNLFARTCEMCSTTLATDKQWESHLESRKHRGLLKRLQNIPPETEYMSGSLGAVSDEQA